MSTGRDEKEKQTALEKALRRRAASADNRRDLNRMPQFRVDSDLPDQLRVLLGRLDRAERSFR